jgi:hypothetical protein
MGSQPDAHTAIARIAAQMVPAHAAVRGIGLEDAYMTPLLPTGCTFLTGADEGAADITIRLGPDLAAGPEALASIAQVSGLPLICTWPLAGTNDPLFAALERAMRDVGFRLRCGEQASPALGVFKFVPASPAGRRPGSPKRVLVLSHYDVPNFGDRLGYHVLNSVLPAEVEVAYGRFHPWTVPAGDYDLLIIGIGNSLLPRDAAHPELARLLDHIPRAIGIFGTQFREQFTRYDLPRAALDRILAKVMTWWARYEEDVLAFGKGRTNVRHLGDWLIAAAPMTRPQDNKTLNIPARVYEQEVALDRLIQRIQSYRSVSSGRLHTLLAALPSAEEVAYQEQRLAEGSRTASDQDEARSVSGKFRSLLYDVFGRTFAEDRPFPVNREAVRAYKSKVQANMEALRAELFTLLDCELPSTPR